MTKAILIKDNIYWVGARDYNSRNFHGAIFPIEEGTTYNAYLVIDKEVTLIDTVELQFMDEMLERIKSVIKDQPIDNVIIQHGENDHASGFTELVKHYPNIKAYASKAGVLCMQKQYFKDFPYIPVKSYDTLKTGEFTLTFLEMPLIHWPDNMLTFISEAKIIFSNDAFGQHIISSRLFDTYLSWDYCYQKAKDYYANIVMPYGLQVSKKLMEIAESGWEFDMIAPSHGVIFKSYLPQLISAYQEFSTMASKPKAIIIYDSVWNNTQQMGEALAEGLGESMEVKIYKISITSANIIMKELLDSQVVLIGSGCYNNIMAPSIAGFIEKLKSMRITNKKAIAFSSYGWFPGILADMNERLVAAGFELINSPLLNQNYAPNEIDLEKLQEEGKIIGDSFK